MKSNSADIRSHALPRGLLALVAVLLAGALSAPAMAEDVTDMEIVRAIEDEMWVDEVVDPNTVTVSCDRGVVTLTGSVTNILTRARTAEIAASTVGVRAIINQVEVEPLTEVTDANLELVVENALLADPATESYEIDVSAQNGLITLTGTVQSWQEKQLAATVAMGVIGVTDVDNELLVAYERDRPDSAIEADVKGRLGNDVRVDDYLIEVEVDDGVVQLSGTVGSLAEKYRAMADAWVAGTDDVDGSGLDIEWWARDTMRRKSAYITRTDEQIRQAVEDAFVYDPRVLSFEPEVSVSDGTVTLTGVVDNLAARRAAEQDARNVIGVWRVKNHLKVRPITPVGDRDLERRVADALAEDPYLERSDIDIDADLGLVILTGKVNTTFEKNWAEIVAESVSGVVTVINSLEAEHRPTLKPDWEIRADIRDQLWWDSFVDSEDVNVMVENGIATLSGEVDTWAERSAAEHDAFDGGAKDVRNNLTVRYRHWGPYPAYDYPLYPFGY